MQIVKGSVIQFSPISGNATIICAVPTEAYIKQNPKSALVLIEDSRCITPDQRAKAHALINEISAYSGVMPEHLKKLFKLKFLHEQMEDFYSDMSLSNCSMELAREFISYLIDFIIDYEVPTKTPLIELCDDIERYTYICAKRKVCTVCGKKGELHHIDSVGMGRDREEIIHEGLEVMTLCREHHSEIHTIGAKTFFDKYHLNAGIKCTKELCKIYKIKGAKNNE